MARSILRLQNTIAVYFRLKQKQHPCILYSLYSLYINNSSVDKGLVANFALVSLIQPGIISNENNTKTRSLRTNEAQLSKIT